MKKVIYAAAVLFSVGIAHAGERLSGDELKEFYSDTTVSGVHFKLGPGKTYFSSDGSVHSKSESGNERIGNGGSMREKVSGAYGGTTVTKIFAIIPSEMQMEPTPCCMEAMASVS